MPIYLVLAITVLLSPLSVQAAETTMCTMQYQPVCGAKPVQCVSAPCYPVYHTYGNSCVLGVEKGTFIHDGECTATESGPVKPQTQPYVPPATCVAWFDGCNSCSRNSQGQSMCTLRACMNEPAAGYCTEYAAASPTKPPAPAPVVTSEAPVESPSAIPQQIVTETEQENPGFFARMWTSIRNWVASLFVRS